MEDRHYISEPRIPERLTDPPSWEVDIMREGVDTPIMTLLIHENNLPPRKRKKRVVWRLPSHADETPKFGQEDTRRILELFKEKKKLLKKQRKFSQRKSDIEGSSDSLEVDEGDENPSMETQPITANESLHDPACAQTVLKPETAPSPLQNSSSTDPESTQDISDRQVTPKSSKKKNSKRRATSTSSPSNKDSLNDPQPPKEQSTESAPVKATVEETVVTKPESHKPVAPARPPPGLGLSNLSISSTDEKKSERDAQANDENDTNPLPPLSNPNVANPVPAGISPSFLAGMVPPPMPPPQLRQFVAPAISALGQIVTESYFTCLNRGMIEELAAHFTPSSQKTLTVGGAHAVCCHPGDRLLQLQGLTGMVVNIKGTLQQPSVNGSILVISCGICLHPHSLPFSHTLVLVPVAPDGKGGFGYQIQNDALCFLNAE